MTAPLRHPLAIDRKRPHAIVIGAGIGGLACAVRLGARGYQVTIFENLEQAGGRANVYRQDGYTFDAGPTIITAPHLLAELWTICGKRMEDEVPLVPMDPFYRIWFHDGSWLDCSGDTQAMEREVLRLSPGDLDGYRRFMKKAERIYQVGFEKLGNQPFNTPWDMAKAVPEIVGLGGLQSIFTMATRYVKDQRLRIALSFHPLFIGGNPLSASAIYALVVYLEKLWGVHFAMGGTGAFVKGLVRLIEGQGNQIFYSTQVASILTENGVAKGVRLATGEEFAADIVVSNADANWTYEKLIPDADKGALMSLRMKKLAHTSGIFIWYFGTKKRFDDVMHHNIILGPRYEGLLRDIFYRKKLAEDFSLYLYRPTATDPSLAPKGCDAFYVLSPVPHLAAKVDWRAHAEPYRMAVQKRLEETLLPGLGEVIATSKVMTPLDFRDRFLAPSGAAFGMEPILSQSAYFRPQNRSHWLKNLYLVGAGTHPGAGITGVVTSARVTDELIPDPRVFA
ncbi:MAG: phytoene desaturase [Beijerinckiaceae bacterium]